MDRRFLLATGRAPIAIMGVAVVTALEVHVAIAVAADAPGFDVVVDVEDPVETA